MSNSNTEMRSVSGDHKVHQEKTRVNARKKRRRILVGLSLSVLGGLGIVTAVMRDQLFHSVQPMSHAHGESISTNLPMKVKVIRPKPAAELPIFAEQLGIVEAYYRADLRARASGIVRRVPFDIGDPVSAGDVLAEIDVPELEQDVGKAEKSIDQRRQELRVAEAKYKDAVAAKLVAAATVKQKKADAQGLTASRDLRKAKVLRYKDLSQRGTVVGSVVEEEERDYLAAEGALLSAMAAIEKAEADLAEMDSKIEAAAAEVDLRKVMIEVSQKELQRALAIADNARVVAPFDGVVVQRSIDPGSFVQNATSGNSETLISISKIDIVTISARFPDSVAPFVSVGNSCDVFVDDLGLFIPAKVTRFSPMVQSADRSMRVEVDLFNGTQEDLENLLRREQSTGKDRQTKGLNDKIPVPVFVSSETTRRIIPGMTGRLRLKIAGFGESYLLPSNAIYSRSGQSYILLVQDNRTTETGVRVQFNDGKSARVTLVDESDENSNKGAGELTGSELVVISKQLEIGRDRDVESIVSDW